MDVKIPDGGKKILDDLTSAGFEAYVVGGAVRDVFMGKAVYDWDFTTNATPQEMLKILKDAFYENAFGTVGVPSDIDGERPYEITTFRTEHGYSDGRRPDKVLWGKSIEEDLQRRDFTINAMALRLSTVEQRKKKKEQSRSVSHIVCSMQLIDPYGGRGDLERKLIRAVGSPVERFSEDALRMMRAIRIASEIGFNIEEKTFDGIQKNAHLIKKISGERIRDELLKTLSSKNPSDGIIKLKDSGLMRNIFPELVENFGVPQASPGRHHIYDVGTHSVYSLKYVSERNQNPIVRLATLIHDIGKAKTYKKLKNGTITFYNHEIISAQIAKTLADRLRLSNKDRDKLWKLVRFHQFTLDEKQTDSAIRRFIRNVGAENLNDMLDLRVGDRLGGGARETSWRLEEFKKRIVDVQKQPFSIQDLKITGYDVMKTFNIKTGKKVGEILKLIFKEVESGKLKNVKPNLQKRLIELAKL